MPTGRMARIRFPVAQNFSFFSTESRLTLGSTQSPIQWVLEPLSSVVKRQEREGYHSPPISADVKKGGVLPSLPHTSLWHIA
jgi:hypothetical protein